MNGSFCILFARIIICFFGMSFSVSPFGMHHISKKENGNFRSHLPFVGQRTMNRFYVYSCSAKCGFTSAAEYFVATKRANGIENDEN